MGFPDVTRMYALFALTILISPVKRNPVSSSGWNFYDAIVDPNGSVGDGFGSQLALGADGKHMQVLSESFTNTQTLVYMD